MKGLRDAVDMTVEEMAAECEIDVALLEAYESGTSDIPVSFLHRLATTFGVGVDSTSLRRRTENELLLRDTRRKRSES